MSTTLHDTTRTGVDVETHPRAVRRNPALRGPILLATDGTGKSGAAVVAARLLASQLDVPLEVVAVVQPQAAYGLVLGGTPIYLPEVYDLQQATLLAEVKEYVERFSEGAPMPTVHVRFGSVADEIAEVAKERSATLIVVGAAPRQRVNRIIAGERAVHVLRASTVPVLSVPPGFSALPKNIVVAVDFAPASVRAAQTALLLLPDGGTLTLLHVMSPLLGDAPVRDSEGRDPADAIQTLFGRLRDELRPFAADTLTIETCIRSDDEIDGIVDGATAMGADLIAVGTQGPRLLEWIFLGSVASSVLHAAPQPVLAAPPPVATEALEIWLRITGTATSTKPREWTEALNEFTRRNAGRLASIEVDDPEIGAQMLARGALVGVTYDRHDQQVEVMVGDAHKRRRHLMHSIADVESIGVTADDRGTTEALELRHGKGHTLVIVVR